MAEIDPDKILAELEAARLQIRRKGNPSSTGIPKEGRNLLIGLIAVLGFAALALWILLMVLEQIPHRSRDPQADRQMGVSEGQK